MGSQTDNPKSGEIFEPGHLVSFPAERLLPARYRQSGQRPVAWLAQIGVSRRKSAVLPTATQPTATQPSAVQGTARRRSNRTGGPNQTRANKGSGKQFCDQQNRRSPITTRSSRRRRRKKSLIGNLKNRSNPLRFGVSSPAKPRDSTSPLRTERTTARGLVGANRRQLAAGRGGQRQKLLDDALD
jgi:hypothetical protein